MTDEELSKELEKYADGLVGVPVLKGLPRAGLYAGDREREERQVTDLVLAHLGYQVSRITMEPLGKGKIPDVEATLLDGRLVGIEVTELLDAKLRRERIERREEERRLSLTQHEAFMLDLNGKNPTPGYVSRQIVANWTLERLRTELGQTIAKKDYKVEHHRLEGVDFDRFSEMLLAIFTGEEVTLDLIAAVKNTNSIRSKEFSRVVIVMDYEPQTQIYPVLVL